MKILLPVVALIAVCAGLASGAPRITLSKNFPGSVPAFVSIEIEQDGAAVYKEAVNDEYPLKFKLDPEDVSEVFRLAEKLGFFTREVESGLKVANMGIKSFRWEDGATKHEVKFNYSADPDAQALADWFEKMSETEQGVHPAGADGEVRQTGA